MFSDVMVSKWSKIPDSEIPVQAKKLKSNKHLPSQFNVETTFEEAVDLLDDAEKGIPIAIKTVHRAASMIEREYRRFTRVRWLYIIAIAIISIIDFILLYS